MTGEIIYYHSISIFLFFRFLINEPAWLDSWCYCLFECLCLGPVYRLLFWLTVKTVNVHIVKTFNTEGRHQEPNQQYSERGTNPYSNNLEGFVIKKFTPGNSAGEEQVSFRAGSDAVCYAAMLQISAPEIVRHPSCAQNEERKEKEGR